MSKGSLPAPALCLALLAAALAGAARGQAGDDVLPLSRFEAADVGKSVPSGWKELTFNPSKFPKKSTYEVVRLDGRIVLKASTQGGVSALYRPLNVDPKEYPYLAWRWRADNRYPGVDQRTKAGDDYPARVYIAFRYVSARVGWFTRLEYDLARRRSREGQYPPLYALNCVWANTARVNTWFPNPWQDRAKMIVVRTGAKGLKEWHQEARNYLADFKAIVGEEPTPVEYVAVMIDGDGSGSSGTSYFADIELRKTPPPGFERGAFQPPKEAD